MTVNGGHSTCYMLNKMDYDDKNGDYTSATYVKISNTMQQAKKKKIKPNDWTNVIPLMTNAFFVFFYMYMQTEGKQMSALPVLGLYSAT